MQRKKMDPGCVFVVLRQLVEVGLVGQGTGDVKGRKKVTSKARGFLCLLAISNLAGKGKHLAVRQVSCL